MTLKFPDIKVKIGVKKEFNRKKTIVLIMGILAIAVIITAVCLIKYPKKLAVNQTGISSIGESSIGYIYDRGNDKAVLHFYQNDNKCSFTLSHFSSYFPIGNYKENENYFIMETDDGNNTYTFKKENGNLIFVADKSSAMPKYAYSEGAKPEFSVPDGAVYKKIASKKD